MRRALFRSGSRFGHWGIHETNRAEARAVLAVIDEWGRRLAVSASVSALSVSSRQLGSAGGAREPQNHARCQLWSLAVSSRPVLAMQKVEGSSPFIRFAPLRNIPGNRA